MDRRAAALEAEDPNFADNALSELVSLPGIDTEFNSMPPVIQATVV
jgi:hypothetical protein